VTTTENLVDAAVAGLDQGEAVTWPSVAEASPWDTTMQPAPHCLPQRRSARLLRAMASAARRRERSA
jgi:hypothetical protein